MSGRESMIEARDLVKTYLLGGNTVRALDHVDVRIDAGEMVAIRGPSGSGKSTLMNVLGCLDRPTSGEYLLTGENVANLSGNRLADIRNERIGFVFQTFNLLPRMTALENVELPLLYSARPDARARAKKALEIVGLGDRMHHEPNQLSGGQRQRVSIARAIVTDPAIVLADEPTGALDTRTGEEILALFANLNQQGRTIIVVTHDLSVARHCQREIYLRDGKVSVDEVNGRVTDRRPAETDKPASSGGSIQLGYRGTPQAHARGGDLLIWLIILKSAMKSLLANKLRSILAMLGIIIGVAAVIAMLAMGAGAQAQVMQRFQAMGTNLLFVRPAQSGTGGVNTGMRQTLVVDDVEAIAKLPGVSEASPVVSGRVQAKYMNNNLSASINGVAMPYFHMRNFEVAKGRAFTETESEGRSGLAHVVVLGPSLAHNLFDETNPIGQQIKLNNINFDVIGVLKSKGDQGWNNPDDQAMVPYTTAMKVLFANSLSTTAALKEVDIAIDEGADINKISGQPAGASGFGPPGARGGTKHVVPPPEGSVTALLRQRHRLFTLDDADDFTIMNQAELLATVSASIGTFRILLATIAAISLLVGGIGIMNIMLVTVTERTREIGVRKAIGAKNRAILTQFVVEAVFMSGIGGMLGAGLGIGASLGIAYLIGRGVIPSQVPVPTVQAFFVILSVAVSGVVGIVFGVYPAYRAAQLDPIDALRYE